jgi:hypothetical protein
MISKTAETDNHKKCPRSTVAYPIIEPATIGLKI